MKRLLCLLLWLQASFLYGQDEAINLLQRTDMGLTIAIPAAASEDALRDFARFLQARPKQKYAFTQSMRNISPRRPILRVSGDMKLHAAGPDLAYPIEDEWIDCNDVKNRRDQASQVLDDINSLQDELLDILEEINSADEARLRRLLAEVELINSDIMGLFDSLTAIYPSDLNEKSYELVYDWPQTMNQICSHQSPLTPEFRLQEFSMPGAYWQITQGGRIDEFASIEREPYFGTQNLRMAKKVSAQQLCLDTQKIQMLVAVKPLQQAGCSYLNPSTEIMLEAGDLEQIGEPSKQAERMQELPCQDLVTDYRDWLGADFPGSLATVNFEMMSNKIRWERLANGLPKTHGGYMRASLGLHGAGLAGTGRKLFSERFDNQQGFALNQADTVELRMRGSGKAEIRLKSWGDTVLPLQAMHCYRDHFADFITGFLVEGNGTSALTITLEKSKTIRRVIYPKPILSPDLKKKLSSGLMTNRRISP